MKKIKGDGSIKRKILKDYVIQKYVFLVIFLIWPLTQFAIFYVYMNASNIMLAFKGMRSDSSTYWVGFRNFKTVLNGVDTKIIIICLFNNLTMSLWTTLIGLPLNILFAFYLFKKKLGSGIIRIIYMLPNMVSGVVMTMLFMKFVEIGLPTLVEEAFGKELPNLIRNNSTAFGIQIFYVLWLGFSTSIILYSNAMFGIDQNIIEACKIDGASSLQELLTIVIPSIMPTISTFMVTGVAGLFTMSGSLFLFYGLNGVPENVNMMGFYLFRIAMEGDLGKYPIASATSILITLVSIPMTLGVRWLMDRADPLKEHYEKIG